MDKKNILIIEDEPNISKILYSYFTKANYNVLTALDGESDLNAFMDSNIDLIILDIMLPKINGFEIAKRIRSTSNVPIIMMTALGDEDNMTKGYQLLCDDYVVKPFSPKILVMKVNNLLNRIDSNNNIKQKYTIKGLTLDFGANRLYVNDKEVDISKTEFKLLSFLINNKDKACSRSLLLDEIWGLDVYVDNRIVDTYVKNLRKLIKPYNYIKTVFGIGYQFVVNENEE